MICHRDPTISMRVRNSSNHVGINNSWDDVEVAGMVKSVTK